MFCTRSTVLYLLTKVLIFQNTDSLPFSRLCVRGSNFCKFCKWQFNPQIFLLRKINSRVNRVLSKQFLGTVSSENQVHVLQTWQSQNFCWSLFQLCCKNLDLAAITRCTVFYCILSHLQQWRFTATCAAAWRTYSRGLLKVYILFI